MENPRQPTDPEELEAKRDKLVAILKGFGSVLVAFSGGLDSSFLLAVASQVLGERVVAATASSPIHPRRELEGAKEFCAKRGIRHIVFESQEMGQERFLKNSSQRCYWCKRAKLVQLTEVASTEGLDIVVHGANQDDLLDYRPGSKAAEELGVRAPLVEAGLGKKEIRAFARAMGLENWDRPASGCLATRIPYGEEITLERLSMIEKAEDFLLSKGLRGVRVRHHGEVARIEVSTEEMPRLIETSFRKEVVDFLQGLGFLYISLDLEGFSSGKMNRSLHNT